MGAQRRPSLWGMSSISLLLMGFVGGVYDLDACRFTTVSGRAVTRTVTGYTDAYSSVTICAYQLRKNGAWVALACTSPSSTVEATDPCGVNWYEFTLNFTLLSADAYWSRINGPEFTRVSIERNVSNGALFTGTDDFSNGPMNDSSCYRSLFKENAAPAPILYYNGATPDDLDCLGNGICIGGGQNGEVCSDDTDCVNTSGVIDGYCHDKKSMAGCPFTCNLTMGCDTGYGTTENRFYDSAHRVNSSGQSTASTRFDHYGGTSASGPPAGSWSYLGESGICSGGSFAGLPCDTSSQCTGGSCSASWTVMRRNSYTADSLNVRRGENRRDSLVEAYVKMKEVDSTDREIGLVNRFYDADNYYVFMVREYGGDYARIQRRRNGAYETVATATPSFGLTSWLRIGFQIRDNGSWVNTGFLPSGTCHMAGTISGTTVVSHSSVSCLRAPYGNYGVFSYYNSSAQFWDLDAYPCMPTSTGKCYR